MILSVKTLKLVALSVKTPDLSAPNVKTSEQFQYSIKNALNSLNQLTFLTKPLFCLCRMIKKKSHRWKKPDLFLFAFLVIQSVLFDLV